MDKIQTNWVIFSFIQFVFFRMGNIVWGVGEYINEISIF